MDQGYLILALFVAVAIRFGGFVALVLGIRNVRNRNAHHSNEGDTADLPLSVVVAARNEVNNLPDLVNALKSQQHDNFEVLIADDNSTDGTPQLVRSVSRTDPRFHLVPFPEGAKSGKKSALSRAIYVAANERIVLTDSDCRPGTGWLRAIARAHSISPTAVWIGHGPLKTSRTLTGFLARFENVWTALLSAAAVGLGRPYMAVGRNLSYPKALFTRIGGFEHADTLIGGDDDLLVQHVRKTKAAEVFFLSDPDSFVSSEGPRNFREWIHRKRRHFSVGSRYDWFWIVALGLFQASSLLLWVLPVFLGITTAVVIWLAKWLFESVCYSLLARQFLKEKPSVLRYPVLDILYVFLQVLWAPISVITKPKTW